MAEKEYIEREAAKEECCSLCRWEGTSNCDECEHPIDDIPAADVRPAVLCRDCEYFSEVMYGGTQFEYGYCDRWADGTRMNPDDFCSYGEKREES